MTRKAIRKSKKAFLTERQDPPALQILLLSVLLAFGSPIVCAQTAQLSPYFLTFATQPVGITSSGQSITLTNTAAYKSLTIGSIAASGDYAVSHNCGAAVPPHGSCTLTVTFTPSTNGTTAGEITVSDNAAGSPQVATLTGTGVYPVTSSPATLGFSHVIVGRRSPPKNVTITNALGTSVTLSFATTGDYSATPGAANGCSGTLAANSNCTIAVTFVPTRGGILYGVLAVTNSAGFGPVLVALQATPAGGSLPTLAFSPATLSFANVAVGATSKRKTMTITNTGGAGTTITNLSASPDFAASASGSSPCGGLLAAGASCTLSSTFSPTVTGKRAGTLTVTTDDPTGPVETRLSGSAIPPISLSAASLVFANQAVGTTSPPQSVTVTNKESADLTILEIQASGQYVVTPNGKQPVPACQAGSVLSPSGQCTFNVSFSPSLIGTVHGVINVAYSGAYSPSAIPLSGVGLGIGPVSGFAYVGDENSNNIWVYTIDAKSGALSPISGSPFPAGSFARSVTVDPSGKFVYVANYGDNNVSAYTTDAGTGALATVPGSPFAAASGPESVTVDPSGKFVYVANYGDNNVSAYTIEPSTGALTEISGSPFSAGSQPLCVRVDPSGHFVYVTNFSSNNVSAFAVSLSTGALTPVSGSPFPAGSAPLSVVVDPSGRFVYVANDGGGVSAYTVDVVTGGLTSVPGSPFPAGTEPRAVTVDPSGRFVYVADVYPLDPGNVYGYVIDTNTGALTSIPGSPFVSTGGTFFSVAVDPLGKFVYAGIRYTAGVAGYAIDKTTGNLTPMPGSPFPAGTGSTSIATRKK
jgi:6-phosphogluconolactonase